MKRKRVLLAHNNLNFINKANKIFEQGGLYHLNSYAQDGEELLKKTNLDNYDIVIVKNTISRITGLYALKKLIKDTKKKPDLIILLSPFVNQFLINKCEDLGIYYIQDKDLNINKIHELIYQFDMKNQCVNKTYFEPSHEIIRLLKQIGLFRTYIGYTYFEFILNWMFEDADNLFYSMKEIYQMIANHFNVTTISVEKAMRTCIKLSLEKNSNYYSQMLFGHNREKKQFPTTSTFLKVCVKTLKDEKNIIINNNVQRSIRKI